MSFDAFLKFFLYFKIDWLLKNPGVDEDRFKSLKFGIKFACLQDGNLIVDSLSYLSLKGVCTIYHVFFNRHIRNRANWSRSDTRKLSRRHGVDIRQKNCRIDQAGHSWIEALKESASERKPFNQWRTPSYKRAQAFFVHIPYTRKKKW